MRSTSWVTAVRLGKSEKSARTPCQTACQIASLRSLRVHDAREHRNHGEEFPCVEQDVRFLPRGTCHLLCKGARGSKTPPRSRPPRSSVECPVIRLSFCAASHLIAVMPLTAGAQAQGYIPTCRNDVSDRQSDRALRACELSTTPSRGQSIVRPRVLTPHSLGRPTRVEPTGRSGPPSAPNPLPRRNASHDDG
jgi:hypothetical protein